MRRLPAEVTDFVTARWPELQRLAVLIAGDAPSGRDSAADVLAEAARDWHSLAEEGRPREAVVSALLTRLLDPKAPGAVPLAGSWEGPAGMEAWAGHAPPEALTDAWWALTPGERAAYVLAHDRLLGGMPPAPSASDLTSAEAHLDDAHARAELTSGRGPAPGASRGEAVRMLELLAHQVPPWPDPLPLVDARRRRHRRRRGVIAAAVLVIAAAIGGAAALWGPDDSQVTAAPRPSPSGGPVLPTLPGLPAGAPFASWPARGSLASDPTIVSGVVQRSQGHSRILWADDRGGRRYVMTVPRSGAGQPPTVVVHQGPAGAAFEDLEEQEYWLEEMEPQAVVLVDSGRDGPSQLVVVGRPGLGSAVVSETVDVTADLRVTPAGVRRLDRDLVDGVAVVELGARERPALLVLVDRRPVHPLMRMGPPEALDDPEGTWVPCTGCQVPDAVNGMVGRLRAQAADAIGTAPDAIQVDTAFEGPIAAGVVGWTENESGQVTPQAPTPAVLVRMTLPSGAILQSLLVKDPTTTSPRWFAILAHDPVRAEETGAPLTFMASTGGNAPEDIQVILPAGSPARQVAVVVDDVERERVAIVDGAALLPIDPAISFDTLIVRSWDGRGELVSERRLFQESPWTGPWDRYRDYYSGIPG